MAYIFLIVVVSSQSMSMQIEPMQDMAQCQAALKAIDIAQKETSKTWTETIPSINNARCVEVKS
ncbi:hypothetical protein [Obesumbacterium proteus]|uniref:hypothetical protein n=1 Tax=Obesumbacterium proteus TaxID=82983 RepID=UPI001F2333F6|nr:hypothetical protein [Obesumbacterium proteus]MCE9885164.1 hypothetical protein [Obesumbacterium proteus]MCE9914236.1 hypothetical protein [Obesumbacterium proteus]MCE9929334.1 hypothetical protein [Obesumbacterium proteus]MCG2878739.1 hypothetical protein [Obesumbacterium proteus]